MLSRDASFSYEPNNVQSLIKYSNTKYIQPRVPNLKLHHNNECYCQYNRLQAYFVWVDVEVILAFIDVVLRFPVGICCHYIYQNASFVLAFLLWFFLKNQIWFFLTVIHQPLSIPNCPKTYRAKLLVFGILSLMLSLGCVLFVAILYGCNVAFL